MSPPLSPILPDSAPFSPEQRAWLNGFLAGVFNEQLAATQVRNPPAPPPPSTPLLILFGSQTGSAEGLAKKLCRSAEARGFAPRVLSLNDYEKAALPNAGRLIVITSTWGDGDPPDNAAACWTWLNGSTAPRLDHLAFAVLALGDRNYSEFCGAGKKFNARLEALGAKRLLPLGECDVDYESAATAWFESLWPVLQPSKPTNGETVARPEVPEIEPLIAAQLVAAQPVAAAYHRSHPYPARLRGHRRLNRPGSAKDTRHFEISLEGSGLCYEVGDALGVLPANCPVLVEELLAALGFKGEEPVKNPQDQDCTLHEALLKSFVITQPTLSLLKAVVERAKHAELQALLAPDQKAILGEWLCGRDVVDVLRAAPGAKFTAAAFTGLLRPLQPRLYSISSSPKAHPGEVHLTVGTVRFEAHGRARKGVCSTFLADRVTPNETPVPVFVQASHGFRLPTDLSVPIIMVGPGTGIAPFRAFLEERRATGATGRNWIFFGDQQRALDFLYEEELAAMRADGHLTKLDLAFSRDQAAKLYVQHRMMEHAGELWRWLEDGAQFYVCGDARRMAKDVDAALHQVVESAGGKTREQAAVYVAELKSLKRYQRDIY